MIKFDQSDINNLKSSILEELDANKGNIIHKKLGEICNVFSGGTPKSTENEFYKGSIPWLRSGEINLMKFLRLKNTFLKKQLIHHRQKKCKKNSVLIAMNGEPGKVAINTIPLYINQSVCAIETPSYLSYKFLFYYLWKEYPKIKNLGHTEIMSSLNASMIKKIIIPIPPIEVQQKNSWYIRQIYRAYS